MDREKRLALAVSLEIIAGFAVAEDLRYPALQKSAGSCRALRCKTTFQTGEFREI